MTTSEAPSAAPDPGPSPEPDVEARLSALEADVRDIKDLLAQLEPVLGDMDGRIRRAEAETLPTLSAEISDLKDRASPLPSSIQLLGILGGLLALVVALTGLGLMVARFGLR